jgi:ABC-type uncharacterized transport system permease subunit
MFLMQRHDLKFHKLRALLSLLPSIQRLELITFRLVAAGFLLLTFGLAAGSQLPRPVGEHYLSDPKVLWSALLWLVYLEALVAYKIFGRSGRRFAIGVAVAFVFLLLTFGLTNRFSPMHQRDTQPTTNSPALSATLDAPSSAASQPSPVTSSE